MNGFQNYQSEIDGRISGLASACAEDYPTVNPMFEKGRSSAERRSPRRPVDGKSSGRCGCSRRPRSTRSPQSPRRAHLRKNATDATDLVIIKATSADVAAARNEKDLIERVWRLSNPPRNLETKATITAKMFLDAETLVRLKMSRNPCASGPFPTYISSTSEPDFTADSLEPSNTSYQVETPKLDETLLEDSSDITE